VYTDGSVSLSLQISSSDNESTWTPATRANKRIGCFRCRAADCSATFRQSVQLARHYTGFHPCDFGPPRDEHDLAIYNQCITTPPQSTASTPRSTASRKR